MDALSLTDLLPSTGLRAVSGNMELRWIDDELLLDLAHVAARGVHTADQKPFNVPWTDGTPAEVARSVMTFQWSNRGAFGPTGPLRLELGVLVDGKPVGIQGASGDDWSVLRAVETGSWLGREFHGRGIGKRMRALMLHLLFDGLGAEHVFSAAFVDNPASNAVSRATGYRTDGQLLMNRMGQPAFQDRYRIDRAKWPEVKTRCEGILDAPVQLFGTDAARIYLSPA